MWKSNVCSLLRRACIVEKSSNVLVRCIGSSNLSQTNRRTRRYSNRTRFDSSQPEFPEHSSKDENNREVIKKEAGEKIIEGDSVNHDGLRGQEYKNRTRFDSSQPEFPEHSSKYENNRELLKKEAGEEFTEGDSVNHDGLRGQEYRHSRTRANYSEHRFPEHSSRYENRRDFVKRESGEEWGEGDSVNHDGLRGQEYRNSRTRANYSEHRFPERSSRYENRRDFVKRESGEEWGEGDSRNYGSFRNNSRYNRGQEYRNSRTRSNYSEYRFPEHSSRYENRRDFVKRESGEQWGEGDSRNYGSFGIFGGYNRGQEFEFPEHSSKEENNREVIKQEPGEEFIEEDSVNHDGLRGQEFEFPEHSSKDENNREVIKKEAGEEIIEGDSVNHDGLRGQDYRNRRTRSNYSEYRFPERSSRYENRRDFAKHESDEQFNEGHSRNYGSFRNNGRYNEGQDYRNSRTRSNYSEYRFPERSSRYENRRDFVKRESGEQWGEGDSRNYGSFGNYGGYNQGQGYKSRRRFDSIEPGFHSRSPRDGYRREFFKNEADFGNYGGSQGGGRSNEPGFPERSSRHESGKKSIKRVLCKELSDEDIGKCVRLRGRLVDGKGCFWEMKDESGNVCLYVPEDKKIELEKELSEFKINVNLGITGIIQKNEKNPNIPYTVVVDNVSFLKLKENIKNGLRLKLNEKEISKMDPVHMTWFFQRSHSFDQLGEKTVGQNVTLCGWVTWICDLNRNLFMLQDGVDKILIDGTQTGPELDIKLQDLELNFLVLLDGEVVKRPENEINTSLRSGTIKVQLKEIRAMDKIQEETSDEFVSDDFVDEENNVVERVIEANPNLYTLRSHNLGEINRSKVGQDVSLMGWVVFIRMNQFFVLKDRYGTVQLILPKSMFESLDLNLESVIAVEGTVQLRPKHQVLLDNPSGEVEVLVKRVKVISRAEEIPFTFKTFCSTSYLLLQYRYLDIRMSPTVMKNLIFRSEVLMKMREFLSKHLGFLEVETPVLSRLSPGGAREFVVPTRIENKFYGLVQSPQLFKQMLMIGAVDRYFQIARCFRDEMGTKNRQPEFTQLDLEMSFCDQDGVLNLMEDLLKFVWPPHLPPLKTPFPRLKYSESMTLYRTDKPDLRCPNQVVNLRDEMMRDADFLKYASFIGSSSADDLEVEGLVLPIERKYENGIKELNKYSRNYRIFCNEESSEEELRNKLSGFCSVDTFQVIKSKLVLKPGDVFIVVFGAKNDVEAVVKQIQSIDYKSYGNKKQSNSFKFVWITDFPLFKLDKDGVICSAHHPFTQPAPEDMDLLDENPLMVRGQSYDLVLNGTEIGGGSMRITDNKLQRKIIKDILKLDEEPFRYFLRALSYGAPIHGGFALGIDRFLAMLQNLSSIEEVIAFPKYHSGQDPLTGAPCSISDDDKRLYCIEHGMPKLSVKPHLCNEHNVSEMSEPLPKPLSHKKSDKPETSPK